MATKPNPTPTNLAQLAVLIGQLPANHIYPSAQAMCVAAHPALAAPTNKSLCTAMRGVMRGTNHGVGRGNRYNGLTPANWQANYKAIQAQRAQAQQAAQQARTAAKVPAGK